MHSQDHPYYRHPDGTFRLDQYRAEALAMRRAVMEDTSRLASALKLVAIVAVLVGLIAVAPPRTDDTDSFTISRSPSQTAASHAAPARPPVF